MLGKRFAVPRGTGSEAYLNGTSREARPEDTPGFRRGEKDGQIRGRSKRFMKHPG
jgi:hypothetical protein